jgi:glucosamine--fructose-6-phosphate aminotransferase (isomerizing)
VTDPAGFLADLEAKPAALRGLAARLRDEPPWRRIGHVDRVIALGLGSSRFAALPVTARLRAARVDAVAEHAGALGHPGGNGTLAVGISASGATPETVEALRRHAADGSDTAAVTNDAGSPLAEIGAGVVDLAAGSEDAGVACRTFQHTILVLLALLDALCGRPIDRVAALAERAADATEDLLGRRDRWLAPVTDLLTATGTTFVVAPAERRSSAEQGALMLREGPRLVADACETVDWSHVDVYLTKPLDYRALLFAGSGGDAELMRWARERGSTVVAVGDDVPGAAATVRYRGDDDPDLALVTEVLVPELVAQRAWAGQETRG